MIVVYIDIKQAKHLTLGNVERIMTNLKKEHPDQEIFWDGDLCAIVGRVKA